MTITISNESLTLSVDTLGAETKSLKDRITHYEFLWQGDPAFWTGTSPILFPAVGGHWNGVYRHLGRTYNMPKHGFVRTKEWTVVDQSETHVTLVCQIEGEDLRIYPFPSRVGVTYRLDGRKLQAEFAVENCGETTMYFQIGGHPGINLPDFRPDEPVSGYITLEGSPHSLLRATLQGCTAADRFSIPYDLSGRIPLCRDTFADEALIFDRRQLTAANILGAGGSRLARVESDAPVWLFWAPQGQHAPFVCAEPWYGLCDPVGFDGPLSERPYINKLDAGECWHGGYSLELF